ncbi:MAG: S8 family peptidase [Theionarchaea archaeon]|nr:S8 family peptidase [Theionarchaea archaeon]
MKEMYVSRKIQVSLVLLIFLCSMFTLSGDEPITIHLQSVGYEGKDIAVITLPLIQDIEGWMQFRLSAETRKILSTSVNIDRLPEEYVTLEGTMFSIYKGALTQIGEREYIAYVKNDVVKIGWALRAQIAAAPSGDIETLVMFRGSRSCDTAALRRYGSVEYLFHSGYGAFMKVNAKHIPALSQIDGVLFLDYNREVQAHLSNAIPFLHVDQVWEMGYDGTGVVIAIIDTGLDPNHCDLSGKIVSWKDFIGNLTTPYDDHGHGTFLASCAAGQYSPMGVAPGASLMGVKVLDYNGSGTSDDIIAGIDWAVANEADVINLSLGAAGGDGTSPIAMECNWAVSKGVTVVTTAGGGGECKTIGTPGDAKDVITVGTIGYDDALATFSSKGPTIDGRIKPDCVAPGVNISAADAGTACSDTTMSGTSISTALVSGVCALILDRNPNATPLQIKNILGYTAADLGNQGKDNYFGWGRVDAKAAVDNAFNNPTPPGPADDPYCQDGSCLGTLLIGFFMAMGLFSRKK